MLTAISPVRRGDGSIVAQPRILIAADQSIEDHADLTQDDEPRENDMHISASLLSEENKLDISSGVVEAVLRQYQARKGRIPFSTHIGWFINLLKDCYLEDQDNDSCLQARDNLKRYIYLASYRKLHRRVRLGQEEPLNLAKILDDTTTDPSLFDQEDIPQELLNLKSTSRQATYLKSLKVLLNREPPVTEEVVEKVDTAPLYDIAGRKLFHEIFSSLIEDNHKGPKFLAMKLAQLGDPERNAWALLTAKDVECMGKLVQGAIATSHNLRTFVAVFRGTEKKLGVLCRHLDWLARVGGVSEKQYRSDTQPQLADSKESAELRQTMATRGWTAAVLQWLDLVSAHEFELDELCPARQGSVTKIKAKHFRNAEVTVMDIEMLGSERTERPTIAGALDMVLNDESFDRQEIETRLARTPQVENSTFHFESVLFSAMILLNKKPFHLTKPEWLESKGISGLEDILSRLLHSPSTLARMATRCCSSCKYLLSMMREHEVVSSSYDLMTACRPNDTLWCTVQLPPSLPKKYLEASIQNARGEAQSKLRNLQDRIYEEKRAAKRNASYSPLHDYDDVCIRRPRGWYTQ